ncbi:MAG: Ppx/GppA phosphatase family protein [Bacteroidota bacterium]|jgi:exopolyphosphatase/guanosine-5'-triphosphate,3'-diphosphate pyrophosphatase
MKIAAIDIGSNAVRLQIARVNETDSAEPFKRVEFVRIPIRLGDDAFKDGKISSEKKQMFYKAMEAFSLLMEAYDVKRYMACATSAMREAANGIKITQKVEAQCGLRIEIIDGRRESELILKSINHLFENDKTYLSIDVGGGSTEMTVIKNKRAFDSVSFDVGTVRLLDGAIKKKNWDALEKYVKNHLTDVKDAKAIATSGTINKIAALLNPGSAELQITSDQLEKFYKHIKKLSYNERIEIYKLNPDRADVIEPSAEIYLKILKWAGIEQLYAPSAGLKDGILYHLMEKKTN